MDAADDEADKPIPLLAKQIAYGLVFASKLHIEFNTVDKRSALACIYDTRSFVRSFVQVTGQNNRFFQRRDGDGRIVEINDNERCLDNEMHT